MKKEKISDRAFLEWVHARLQNWNCPPNWTNRKTEPHMKRLLKLSKTLAGKSLQEESIEGREVG